MGTDQNGGANGPRTARTGGPADEQPALSGAAVVWLNELPERVRPVKTCARFPRIGNRLAELWDQPDACEAFFDDLLLDRRGDRQGFPADVAFEIAALKSYFETAVHPSRQTVWDDIIRRSRSK